MLRISERFTKFAIKREQKKFIFFAEGEQIEPMVKFIWTFPNRRQTESNQIYLDCRGAKEEDEVRSEYLRTKFKVTIKWAKKQRIFDFSERE